MKLALRYFCCAILLAIPALLFASDNGSKALDTGWSVTGTVIAVDSKVSVIDISDSGHRHYTIQAGHALIYIGTRDAVIRDLHRGDEIQVYGRETGDGSVEARTIYKIVPETPASQTPLKKVKLAGTISRVSEARGRLDLKTESGPQSVLVDNSTEIFSTDNRKVDMHYLREGSIVRIEGLRSSKDEVIARIIRTEESLHSVQVRVIRATTAKKRQLAVSPVGKSAGFPALFDVKTGHKVTITKHGYGFAMDRIRIGDILIMEGKWNGPVFVAEKIMIDDGPSYANKGRNYQALNGKIRTVDAYMREFTLRAHDRDWKVYGDRARVWRNGEVVEFEELRQGVQVSVRGNIDGNEVDAERIEITR